MDNPDAEELKKLFEYLVNSLLPSRLVTNFILIAEVVDNDNAELSLSVSDGLTPWAAEGMLRYAEQMVRTGDFDTPAIKDDKN